MNNDKGKLYYGLGLDNNQLRADAAESRNIIKGIGDTAVSEGNRIDSISHRIGAALAVAFSAQQATAFARSIVQVTGEMQQLDVAFTTMLNSKAKSDALLSQAVNFAAKTPYDLLGVADGIKQLLAYGTAAEDAIETVEMLGNVSAGLSVPLGDMVYLYGTLKSQGRAMLVDIRQFAGRGVPIYEELAKVLGVSVSEVNKYISAGKVGFPEVEQAFKNMTSEGGKFYNLMQEQSKTITGQISNLKDNFDMMLNDIGSANEDVISGAISGASYLIENYQEVGETLAALVATYGTYRAVLIATAAIQNSVATVKHTEEAAELYKLLTVEQQAQIAKQGLAKTSAEYYALVKAETAANVQAAQSALTKARADVTAASQAVAARRAEYVEAKQMEQQRLAELMHIGATGTAKQIETAQRKLATAETQRETAALAYQSAARDFNAKKTAVETAARTANTTATAVNTAAQTANVTATGFLTVAKTRLMAVAAKLNAVIMANPYALAAAAAIALGYGLYKLVTYQTEAEKAQSKLNETIKEADKSLQSELYQINLMFARLKAAKEGTDEYKDAKQAIISQYGEYLKKLGDEKTALNDIAAAYSLITEEATKAANARAIQQVTQEAGNIVSEKQSDVYDEVKKMLGKEFKGQKGSDGKIDLADEYLIKLKPVIMGGAEITSDIEAIIKQFDRTRYIPGDPMTGIGSYTYTANALREELSSLAKVRAAAEQSVKEATEKFGSAPAATDGEAKQFDAMTASLQQLMEQLPKAQDALAALKKADTPDAAAIAAKEREIQLIKDQTLAREKELSVIRDVKEQIEALEKEQLGYGKDDPEYKALQTRIDALKTKLPQTAGQTSKAENEAARIKREPAERNQKIQEYEESVKKQIKQAELDISQSRIDAMEEGFAKEQAQIELAYQRLIFANQQREAEMVEALRDARELEWENKNPQAKAKGETFDRSTVTAADLSPEQQAQIAEYYKVAEEIRNKANKTSLEQMLADCMTYEQQRNKITEEYERQRKALYNEDGTLRQGVTQGNVDELNRNEQEALKAVDEQFASREETYQAWMNAIANMTLRRLEQVLAQAERELADLKKSGTADSKQMATARAKVNTARKKVAQARAENEVSPGKRSIKEWEDLYKTLQEAEREFESIGDTVDGTAGKIIDTAGTVLTSTLSMINSIVSLTTASTTGMQTVSLTAAKAIQTVEKASVILTIISAAMSIATAIIGMFNNDDKYQEEIERLQDRIDQLQWELDNADVVRLQNNTFNVLEKVKQVYAETTQEVLRLHATTNRYANSLFQITGRVVYQNEIMQKSVEKLAEAYASIEYTADKALGYAKYDEAKEQLKNLAEQQLLMQEQIRNENNKKDTDHGKIVDWERQIQELGAEAGAIINELVESIIGGSSTDIANELGDAFIDAFRAGEDAAEAWGEKVDDIVANIVKQMLVQKLLEEPLGDLFNEYKDKWFSKDGTFAGFGAVNDSMVEFAARLNEYVNNFQAGMDALPDELKEILLGDIESTREASEKGIATASQESVDELNGRATAIQGHTYSLMESAKLLVANSARILDHLAGIEDNTKHLSKLESIEGDMQAVKNTVNDIALKGIKLKK
jgi:hypothetical protein